MALFDINGNEISSGSATVSEALVRQAIVNGVASGEIELPTTGASGTLSLGALAGYTDWLNGVKTAFDAMMTDYKSNAVDGIPLFIVTDIHGSGLEASRIPHNYDSRIFSLTLGDLCGDYFNTGQIASIKAAQKPITNIVSVAGNHDVVTKEGSDERASYYAVNDAFKCTGGVHPDNKLCQTVYDNLHGVKYVVISPYKLTETGYNNLGRAIGTDEMTWLIDELSRNDGYDIVLCSHEPFNTSWVKRTGETVTDQGYTYYAGVRSVLIARKNKQSGMVTDSDGVEHTFDFTKTVTKCLCSFHGHLHSEMYSQADGWTEYVERQFGINVEGCVSWALIDRNAMTLTIYKAGSDNLVLSIA